MFSKTIYLVEGANGSYDDRMDWVVCAYETEAAAKKFAKKMNSFTDQPSDSCWEKARALDPRWYDDGGYGGRSLNPTYRVVPTELRG